MEPEPEPEPAPEPEPEPEGAARPPTRQQIDEQAQKVAQLEKKIIRAHEDRPDEGDSDDSDFVPGEGVSPERFGPGYGAYGQVGP